MKVHNLGERNDGTASKGGLQKIANLAIRRVRDNFAKGLKFSSKPEFDEDGNRKRKKFGRDVEFDPEIHVREEYKKYLPGGSAYISRNVRKKNNLGGHERNSENKNDDNNLIDRDYIFVIIEECGGKDVLEKVKQV